MKSKVDDKELKNQTCRELVESIKYMVECVNGGGPLEEITTYALAAKNLADALNVVASLIVKDD